MAKHDLTKKSDKDLAKDLAEAEKTLRDFKFALAGSKGKDVSEGKKTRKLIAQILTEQNRRTNVAAQ